MKKIIIGVSLFLVGCGSWNEVKVPYTNEVYCEELHVHFYDHNTCEWVCLDMKEGIYIVDDTLKLKIKTNKIGKITNLKLVK